MTKNKERLWVIMEVEKTHENGTDGKKRYKPIDNLHSEFLWLDPSRIIPVSRLRYGKPDYGDTVFDDYNNMGWRSNLKSDRDFLILDPPPKPEPKSDFDAWVEECPVCDPNSKAGREIKEWLKRMPREERNG